MLPEKEINQMITKKEKKEFKKHKLFEILNV